MQRVRGGGVGLGKLCVGERESISRETVLLAHNTELTVGEVGMPEKSILRNGQTMACETSKVEEASELFLQGRDSIL